MKSNINESPLKTYSTSKFPTIWTDSEGRTIHGYQNRVDLHHADGWRDYVAPTYNAATHKLGDLYYDTQSDTVSHAVVPLSEQELADRQQQALDSDEAASKLATDISNGQIMYQRFFAYLQRQFNTGNLTAAQAKNSVMLLWNPILPINYGQFLVAQLNLNALTPPSNAKELEILNLAKKQINDYLS